MQTERVTFLTSRDHKAALDAFAKESGVSVGHVLREASTSYMAQQREIDANEDEEALKLIARELNEAAPRILATMDRISEKLEKIHQENDAFLRKMGIRK